jgi:phytoene/squalene synthetase
MGSARYWSWLFADDAARAPLLGIYALLAEWNALIDPGGEPAAAQLKLAWWQQETQRIIDRTPAHPVGVYLSALPCAGKVDFSPLGAAFEAFIAESNGVPLEHASDLAPHASALRAGPLLLVSRLAGAHSDENLQRCTQELAVGETLARSVREYRRDARAGRVPFAVDELLAAGIENEPQRLERYLGGLRERASGHYSAALTALPREDRARQRHLLVLAALGRKQLPLQSTALESPRLQDMLLAWLTARRALRIT